jgi:hypothetical protein
MELLDDTYIKIRFDAVIRLDYEIDLGLHNPGLSMISSTARLRSFAEAALKMLLIACAFLPCLPITLPRSSFATLNSKTEVCSPIVSVTSTLSGLSTKAWAMYLINYFIATTSTRL